MSTAQVSRPKSGTLRCSDHATVDAEWVCASCETRFCAECMAAAGTEGRRAESCPKCRGFCRQLDLSHRDSPTEIGEIVADAMAYPFRGSAIILIALGSIFLAFIHLLTMSFRYGIFFAIFGTGYLAAYMFRILATSAQGDKDLPDWPEFTDLLDSIITPFFQLMVPTVLCILPAAAPFVMYGFSPVAIVSALVILAAGSFYLPMALLAVALNNSVKAMHPGIVIPAIQAIPGPYMLCWILLGSLASLSAMIQATIAEAFPLLGFLLNAFVSTVLLTMEVRLVGLVYHANREKVNLF